MTSKEIDDFIIKKYNEAMTAVSGCNSSNIDCLDKNIQKNIDVVVANNENRTGVFTVLLTSVIYKCLFPNQDVRNHQSQIKNGYSGRSFDTRHVTPFLKRMRFPSMNESGWLTRSLEQASPFTLDFKGKITPKELKTAFLGILDAVETNAADPSTILDYILQSIIIQRDKHDIELAVPRNLSIQNIILLLEKHFHYNYSAKGASRLPVIALYAVYQCLCAEIQRYKDKTLMPLESHTSADKRSGHMGDIEIQNADGSVFEAVEVKFGIPISKELVEIAKEKIQPSSVSRYYILSTAEMLDNDAETINSEIRRIKNIHGCQLVVNGVMSTLKYYLRLINDASSFIENYTKLMKSDNAIAFEHRQVWNQLVANFNQ